MMRSAAIARIQQGLGFRSSLDATMIVSMLQEAQRDLEAGRTLPRFLVEEDATFTLVSGTHTVLLPEGFIHLDDEVLPHFTPENSDRPTFLRKVNYIDGVVSQMTQQTDPAAPSIFVVRNTVLDFITVADVDYDFTWNYFKKAEVLATDIENAWLLNAPEWLIGETGTRLARDLRDVDAFNNFDWMKQKAQMATLGELLVRETDGGPLRMGANN